MVLFAAFFAFVVWAFVFQLVPPLLGTLRDDFRVDPTQSSLLMSMVVIPGILLALPAGLIVNRHGFRLLGFLSIVSVAAGSLITAVAGTFPVALTGRFILGVGGAFLIVGAPTIIPQWFPRRELGKAMGIYGVNMPVATIVAFPTATILAQSFGWRCPFYVGTAVSLTCAAAFALTVREGPLKGEYQPVSMEEVRRAAASTEVWKTSIVWLFFETVALAYLTWTPQWFNTVKGFEPLYASILASLLMVFAIFFVPVFGWTSDRLGRRKPIIVAGLILMALSLIAIAYATGFALLFSVGLLGVSASMTPALVMVIITQNLPLRLSGTGFGVLTLCQNLGISLGPPVAGYLMQTTQSLILTFSGISLFAFAGAVTALTIRTK